MTDHIDWLGDEVQLAFAAGGSLSSADPGFHPRAVQTEMALAVAGTLQNESVLVVEAGTGVGKTFAYLVPLLLSGKRALVSTATKSLQDQLFGRDLPRLVQALGLSVRTALLKGRGAYLCPHRLEQARQTASLPDRWSIRALAKVETWAQTTHTGDLAEIDALDERSPVIPLVTSTRENCLGSECPKFRGCYVMQARREAMNADVVVVNHHLFFADLALRDTGMAELLPSVEAVVFDEAHQLGEAGVQFLGMAVGTGQLLDFARDLLAVGLAQARGLQAWQELSAACERGARELRLAAAGALRGGARLRWSERAGRPDFTAALLACGQACDAAAQALDTVAGAAPDLAKLHERALAVVERIEAFTGEVEPGHVRWIDLSAHQARLSESPLDIRETMREQVEGAARAWIFTSATLGDDEGLTWFTRGAGLEDDARVLRLGSPYDYAEHARLYVPSHFPKPNEVGHSAQVAALAARCAQALGGRTFVLTTTLRALQTIQEALAPLLAASGDFGVEPIELLVQGQAPKRTLLARFLSHPRALLVGSASFWEGIDVPGAALQCVLIDKLPFPPPNDPLVEARGRAMEAEGQDPFQDYFIPEAAIALKQGAGRLIRSETDHGLLVVCDPRLVSMGYGQRLIDALPPMGRIIDEAEALAWLQDIATITSPS
jgi:ATP-dependent DNA helicase DinG